MSNKLSDIYSRNQYVFWKKEEPNEFYLMRITKVNEDGSLDLKSTSGLVPDVTESDINKVFIRLEASSIK